MISMNDQTLLLSEEQKKEIMELHARLQQAREAVMKRREAFAERYSQAQMENPEAPHEALKEFLDGNPEYAVPNLDGPPEGGVFLWTLYAIAKMMSAATSEVAGIIEGLRTDGRYPAELRRRVEECRHSVAGREDALYDDRIFDVLFDCHQEDCLHSLALPNRQTRLPTLENAEQIQQFWDALSRRRPRPSQRREGPPAAPEDMERIRQFWNSLGKPKED